MRLSSLLLQLYLDNDRLSLSFWDFMTQGIFVAENTSVAVMPVLSEDIEVCWEDSVMSGLSHVSDPRIISGFVVWSRLTKSAVFTLTFGLRLC